MVKNSGAETRSGAIKLLNQPEPVDMLTDDAGNPVSVSVRIALPAHSPTGNPASSNGARKQPPGPRRRRSTRVSKMHTVQSVDDRWKVNDEWWRGPEQEIERMYYSLLLENGHRVVVYRDMKANNWYRQSSR
ncbi:MAG: hypothetical protein HQ478_02415 [Chloroflexi bacterium]|nr:hypothetical protein [Chloroflexota bacterium]